MGVRTERGVLKIGVIVPLERGIDAWQSSLTLAAKCDFNFVSLPLTGDVECSCLTDDPLEHILTVSDRPLSAEEWACTYLSVCPHLSEDLRDAANMSRVIASVTTQCRWAKYCGAAGVILKAPDLRECEQDEGLEGLATRFASVLRMDIPVLVDLPFHNGGSHLDPWNWWSMVSRAMGLRNNIKVALRLDRVANSVKALQQLLRWKGENIGMLLIPRSTFLDNQAGFPVLPRVLKPFVTDLAKQRIPLGLEMALTEKDDFLQEAQTDGNGQDESAKLFIKHARAYLAHLWTSLPPMTDDEKARLGFSDVLQTPLQPLADDLESATYGVFEADVTKYRLYGEAIEDVLRSKINCEHIHLAYCGGGRGPLMDQVFRAMRRLGMSPATFTFTIVEKNENAIRTLKDRVKNDPEEYWRRVNVICDDMRHWKPPVPIDILVSELLGSFGDNELSPECLDSVESHLSENAVSIPCSYTSTIEPIASASLYNLVNDMNGADHGYVVDLKAFYPFSNEGPLDCFTFQHPIRDQTKLQDPLHNDRHTVLKWTAKTDALCHGFACYFSAQLSADVVCSTSPSDASEGMSSWFPLYLPLRDSVFLKRDETVTLSIWRYSTPDKVWYEWCVQQPWRTCIQNVGGTSWSSSLTKSP